MVRPQPQESLVTMVPTKWNTSVSLDKPEGIGSSNTTDSEFDDKIDLFLEKNWKFPDETTPPPNREVEEESKSVEAAEREENKSALEREDNHSSFDSIEDQESESFDSVESVEQAPTVSEDKQSFDVSVEDEEHESFDSVEDSEESFDTAELEGIKSVDTAELEQGCKSVDNTEREQKKEKVDTARSEKGIAERAQAKSIDTDELDAGKSVDTAELEKDISVDTAELLQESSVDTAELELHKSVDGSEPDLSDLLQSTSEGASEEDLIDLNESKSYDASEADLIDLNASKSYDASEPDVIDLNQSKANDAAELNEPKEEVKIDPNKNNSDGADEHKKPTKKELFKKFLGHMPYSVTESDESSELEVNHSVDKLTQNEEVEPQESKSNDEDKCEETIQFQDRTLEEQYEHDEEKVEFHGNTSIDASEQGYVNDLHADESVDSFDENESVADIEEDKSGSVVDISQAPPEAPVSLLQAAKRDQPVMERPPVAQAFSCDGSEDSENVSVVGDLPETPKALDIYGTIDALLNPSSETGSFVSTDLSGPLSPKSAYSASPLSPSAYSERSDCPSANSESPVSPSAYSEALVSPSAYSEALVSPSAYSEALVSPSVYSENPLSPISACSEPPVTPSNNLLPSSPRKREADYDVNPTVLYCMIEDRQWSVAAQRAESYPREAKTFVYRTDKNDRSRYKWRMLPIHAAILMDAPAYVIQTLISAYRKGAQFPDDTGDYPIHIAVKKHVSEEKLNLLLQANPDSIELRNGDGRTPLDIANATRSHNKAYYLEALKRGELHSRITKDIFAEMMCGMQLPTLPDEDYFQDKLEERFLMLQQHQQESAVKVNRCISELQQRQQESAVKVNRYMSALQQHQKESAVKVSQYVSDSMNELKKMMPSIDLSQIIEETMRAMGIQPPKPEALMESSHKVELEEIEEV